MKKADFIVIAVVLVIAGVLVFFLYGINSDLGAYVRVEVDGKVVDTLDLNKDATLDVQTDNGGTNTLVIKDGKAKVTEANCPDGICANHKEINKNGESIICLPHKLVVTVVNENSGGDDVDAVA